jgi:hypothetical protein
MNRRVRILLVSALALAACKTTIESTSTDATLVAVTTTVPSGPASELLPRLVTEAGTLSDVIGSRGDKATKMKIINDLYAAVRPEIEATDGVIVLDFDGAIELCRKGEKFNRPADADKCFRNLTALATSYLDTG